MNNEVIYTNPMDKEQLKRLLELSSTHGHSLIFMGAEGMRTTVKYDSKIEESLASMIAGNNIDYPEMDANYFNDTEILQTLLFCNEHEEAPYLDTLKDFNFIRWHENATDVLPIGGSKAMGIERLIEKKGFTKDQVFAFGDYLNDIEMLQYVGHGVAMGNAPQVVKNAARYVTKDVSDNGIAYGLEMVGLL